MLRVEELGQCDRLNVCQIVERLRLHLVDELADDLLGARGANGVGE